MPKYSVTFWAILKNFRFQVKNYFRYFLDDFWKIGIAFYFSIWSHWSELPNIETVFETGSVENVLKVFKTEKQDHAGDQDDDDDWSRFYLKPENWSDRFDRFYCWLIKTECRAEKSFSQNVQMLTWKNAILLSTLSRAFSDLTSLFQHHSKYYLHS